MSRDNKIENKIAYDSCESKRKVAYASDEAKRKVKDLNEVYLKDWNEYNEEIEKIILEAPSINDVLPLIVPKMDRWRKKVCRKSSSNNFDCEDAFSETLYFMYGRGFGDFKRRKLAGEDLHIYPFFLKKYKSNCYNARMKREGFHSSRDYHLFEKLRKISPEHGIKISVENAFIFARLADTDISNVIRVIKAHKTVVHTSIIENYPVFSEGNDDWEDRAWL